MKLVSVLVALLIIGCAVEENTPTSPIVDNFDETLATLIKQGDFIGVGGHTVSGKATVYENNGQRVVVLDPYSSQNGPDLKVYLSKTESANSYINLGKLQSTMGKQTYAIPSSVNFDDYTVVHIWCEQFSVEFARAPLK